MIIHILQCSKIRLKSATICLTKILRQQQPQQFRPMCYADMGMKVSDRMEMLLKKSDHIPMSYRLIYRQKEYRLVNFMYHAVNFFACMSFGAIIYFYYMKYTGKPLEMNTLATDIYNPFQCTVMVLLNLFMLRSAAILRQRWAIRIYHDPNRRMYRAIYHGVVPFNVEQFEFPEKSLSFVNKESSMPWTKTCFHIDGYKRKIMLFDERFRTPDDYYQMLRPDQLHA